MRKIGITMRIMQEKNYVEVRDVLAQNWTDYMKFAFPDCPWMAVPNAGKSVTDIIRNWELNAFIFSGGGDVGQDPLRDETETSILEFAIEHHLPVFGVCRGMQFLQNYFGGTLSHVAVSYTHLASGFCVFRSKSAFYKVSHDQRITYPH